MDSYRASDQDRDLAGDDAPGIEAPPAIGTDERRMQVRAYSFWISLLGGRAYPARDSLDPAAVADFGPHGVLLDFSAGPTNPTIAYLGDKLAVECGHEDRIRSVADVPAGSLLSRLTDHYDQIIANRAPIGFEAEFVNRRGFNTLYRGILMPFSSDDRMIDFLYGVINWKEVADDATTTAIEDEVRDAFAAMPGAALSSWADGPSRVPYDDVLPDPSKRRQPSATLSPVRLAVQAGLSDRLAEAREGAAQALTAGDRQVLNHALALAYEFALATEALPEDYAVQLADADVIPSDEMPMDAIAALVFGGQCSSETLGDYAAALAYGRLLELAPGGFEMLLDETPCGYEALAAAFRAEHAAPAAVPPSKADEMRDMLRSAPATATVTLDDVADEFVILVARREADGSFGIVASLDHRPDLLDDALGALHD